LGQRKKRAKPDRKFPDYAEINAQLNRIETEAAQIALRSQYNKSDLTNEVFKKELDTFLGKKEVSTKALPSFATSKAIHRGTEGQPQLLQRQHQSLRFHFQPFESVCRRRFAARNHLQISTTHFLVTFSNHLFGKGFGNNYVHKLTSTLKTILREADRREIAPELKIKEWLVGSQTGRAARHLFDRR
jgi:hypothetical protein